MIVTAVWLSSAVVKVSFFSVGMVVFLRDEHGHDAPLGLQAQRQRGHVEQEHALDVAGQDRSLDGRADGDDLVGVDPLVRLLAEDLLDDLLDAGHAGRAADQHHLVDVRRLELGVLQGLQDRPAQRSNR